MKTKRVVAVLGVAAGLSFGMVAPAGALIIHGVTDVTIGNPDIRVGVDVEIQPCVAPISLTGTGITPCIAPTPGRS